MCLVSLLGTEASRVSLLAADIAHGLEVVCLDAAVLSRMVCLFSRAVLFAPAAFEDILQGGCLGHGFGWPVAP